MVAAVLERPTLVLNRNWQPVGVVPVTKALTKAWNDTARIVDPADYQQHTWDNWMQIPAEGELFIQTRFTRLRVPEVITLTNYDRLPTNSVTFSRRNVFKRDRFTCQYCGVQPGSDELTIDHVVPRAQGGTSTWKNCVLACIACNACRPPKPADAFTRRPRRWPSCPKPKRLMCRSTRRTCASTRSAQADRAARA